MVSGEDFRIKGRGYLSFLASERKLQINFRTDRSGLKDLCPGESSNKIVT